MSFVVAGVAIGGGMAISGYGAYEAGQAQEDAADQAARLEGQRLAQLKPFAKAGTEALPEFRAGIDKAPTYADTLERLPTDPGYQFELGQGLAAVEGSAAARGMLRSGRTLKDLTAYAQGLASTRAGEAFQRDFGTYQNRQNQLLALIEAGRGASGVQSALPQLALAGGQAQAGAITGMANAGTSALNNIMLLRMLGGGGSAGSGLSGAVSGSGAAANAAVGGIA